MLLGDEFNNTMPIITASTLTLKEKNKLYSFAFKDTIQDADTFRFPDSSSTEWNSLKKEKIHRLINIGLIEDYRERFKRAPGGPEKQFWNQIQQSRPKRIKSSPTNTNYLPYLIIGSLLVLVIYYFFENASTEKQPQNSILTKKPNLAKRKKHKISRNRKGKKIAQRKRVPL